MKKEEMLNYLEEELEKAEQNVIMTELQHRVAQSQFMQKGSQDNNAISTQAVKNKEFAQLRLRITRQLMDDIRNENFKP